MALFKYFKSKVPKKFFLENFIGWNPQKFSPASFYTFMVYLLTASFDVTIMFRQVFKTSHTCIVVLTQHCIRGFSDLITVH